MPQNLNRKGFGLRCSHDQRFIFGFQFSQQVVYSGIHLVFKHSLLLKILSIQAYSFQANGKFPVSYCVPNLYFIYFYFITNPKIWQQKNTAKQGIPRLTAVLIILIQNFIPTRLIHSNTKLIGLVFCSFYTVIIAILPIIFGFK